MREKNTNLICRGGADMIHKREEGISMTSVQKGLRDPERDEGVHVAQRKEGSFETGEDGIEYDTCKGKCSRHRGEKH